MIQNVHGSLRLTDVLPEIVDHGSQAFLLVSVFEDLFNLFGNAELPCTSVSQSLCNV